MPRSAAPRRSSWSCRFSICRWISAESKTELERFVDRHRGDIARDLDGDEGASELHFEGVMKNGTEIVMDNLNVWDFADGKIRRIRAYADTAAFRDGLGIE